MREVGLDGGAADDDHRLVDQLADRRLPGVVLQRLPASLRRRPKDVVRPVLVQVFRIGHFAHFGEQLLMSLLECVGAVLEENPTKHDVFVLGRVHIFAELVGREPELGLQIEIGGGAAGSRCRCYWLCQCVSPTIELRAGTCSIIR